MTIATYPVVAFQENIRAHRAAPWAYQPRLNMMLTLQAVLNLPEKNAGVEIRLSEAAADRAWELGRSASPHHAYLLLLRFNYLVRTGKYDEARPIVAALEARHSHRPEVQEALGVWRSLEK